MTKNVFDAELESRLYSWGHWNIDLMLGNIGYPRESTMAIIIEVGVLISQAKPREPYLNEKAMEVNCWVNRMAKDFPQYAQALKDYYFNPNLPLRVIAEKRGISITTLKARVHDAKVWLSGRLAANDREYGVSDVEKKT